MTSNASEPPADAAARPALSARRQAFVDEYLIDLNATQAAIRAGYKESSAGAQGSHLLRLPAVKAALAEAMAARAARTRVTADRVIEEFARLAFTDMRRYSEWGPKGMTLRPHTALSAEDAAAIVELTPVGEDGRVKIRLHDKRAALDALARHLGLYGIGSGRGVAPRLNDFRTSRQDDARKRLREAIEKIIAARKAAAEKEAGTKEDEPKGG